ncbi:hypothetical protein MERGE_002891 [Pneumocystis wakefieldiae]|uniref:Uncharacterized protein n=1 Tax=Pneumocystis wakefieldiae TaxID=38082 RepID=A0A899G2L7_9ASCO|nr:hypothetical protein MERGE_002891 [Pneumocystis wakefieldiae]
MQQNQPLAIAKRHIKATEKLTRILIGPGAFKLPPDIHGLTLYMAFKNKDGHMGPRKFWKDYLPKLGDIELDMKHKHSSDICQEFVEKTKAVAVGKEEISEWMEKSHLKG